LVETGIKERVQHVGLVTITINQSVIMQQGWDLLLDLVHELDRVSECLGPLGLPCKK